MEKDQQFERPLTGGGLILAAVLLSMANLIAILDMTIANVSIPNIAGSLGVTPTQGTWVITSYAVAEAITVPLTGWFTARYGSVRVFVIAMLGFGLFSGLAGLATSLEFLVLTRVLQGMAGGPLMPLSQTLLLRIFPKEKAAAATGIWAMTTLVGPVLGPILGGWICDNYTWHWIFLINAPFALVCAYLCWKLLEKYETAIVRNPIDIVGFALLVIWVGALQIMLDEGKNLGWFSSKIIISLAIISFIGFIAFLIWELTETHPIVDIRIFRHRGFTAAVLTISLTFAGFFAANVLTPLWLQSIMGYTATNSGTATAWVGITAFLIAPGVAAMSTKYDPRILVFFGVIWIGAIIGVRAISSTDMDYWSICIPLMLLGLGMPFFFIPSTAVALSSVKEEETNSAAGLMNFMRTLAGAIATSVATSYWEDSVTINRAELVGIIDSDQSFVSQFIDQGVPQDMALGMLEKIVSDQSVMLATNQIMFDIAILLVASAFVIWIVPKPTRAIDPGLSH